MKSYKKLSVIVFALMFILNSCTIEKRVYRSGYHIEWNKSNHKYERQNLLTKSDKNPIERNQVEIIKQIEDENTEVIIDNSPIIIKDSQSESNPNSVISIPSDKTIFFTEKNSVSSNSNIQIFKNNSPVTSALKENKRITNGEGKSQLVALLLCIFVGIIGIHRFYLGYIGIGIIQIITLGCCGIWTLIDLIMIVTGGLKPKGGDYGTKF